MKNVTIPSQFLQELLALCGPEDHELRERVLKSAAPAHPAEGVPAQANRDAVIQHLTNAGVLEHDGCGVFIASGDASELIDACMTLPLSTHPTQQGLADDGMYYLQDARWSGMVGNCPSFWRPDGNGYTTNLDEAGRFTHEEAMAQHRSRSTDLPWLCSEVDKLRRPTVDFQHMPRSWDAQRAALAAQAGAQP